MSNPVSGNRQIKRELNGQQNVIDSLKTIPQGPSLLLGRTSSPLPANAGQNVCMTSESRIRYSTCHRLVYAASDFKSWHFFASVVVDWVKPLTMSLPQFQMAGILRARNWVLLDLTRQMHVVDRCDSGRFRHARVLRPR
jgi:hypothetical protein